MNKNRLLKLEKRFNKKTPNELPIFAFTEGDKIVLHKVFFECLGVDTKDYEPSQVTSDFTGNSFLLNRDSPLIDRIENECYLYFKGAKKQPIIIVNGTTGD